MTKPSNEHLLALKRVLLSQLDAIQNRNLSEDNIESLLLTCGDSMLLAALDLVDSADGEPGAHKLHPSSYLNASYHYSVEN